MLLIVKCFTIPAQDPFMPFQLQPAEAWDIDVDRLDYLEERPTAGDRWVLNFGPQHPATHTTIRIVLELDGERVPVKPMSAVYIKPGCRHRAVGRLKIINIPVPVFDPEDEWLDA